MKSIKVLIIGFIITLVGLAVALTLVNKNQETRKKATSESNIISILPLEIKGAVNETKTVSINIKLKDGVKISIAKVKLCYGNALSLTSADIKNGVGGKLTVDSYTPIIQDNCVTISKHVSNDLPQDQWPSGVVPFANLDFKILGNGNLTVVKESAILAGIPDSITVDAVENATVVVSDLVSEGTVSFESSDLMSKKVGEDVNVNLFLDSNKSYSAVDFKICYGDKVTLSNANVTKGEDFTDGTLMSNEGNCLRYVVTKTGTELTGKKKLASLKFVASQVGSGKFESQTDTKFSGSVNGQTVGYQVSGASADYTISVVSQTPCIPSGTITCTPDCPTACGQAAVTLNNCKDSCENSVTRKCAATAACPPAPATCVFTYFDWGVCSSAGTQTRAVNTKLPLGCQGGTQEELSRACTYVVPSTTDLLFNFYVGFAGVPTGAKCGVNWPLQIIVMNSVGVTKTYPNVVSGDTDLLLGRTVYKESIRLTDFPYANNLAVFIKGPKHLQMKYGINNQTGFYGKAGGELSGLTSDPTTTPTFDFSGYPILAGDIAKADGSDGQDGVIDGVDFSLSKTQVLTHTTVADGQNLVGDLDGNCQNNSNDLNILKSSLNKKYSELY